MRTHVAALLWVMGTIGVALSACSAPLPTTTVRAPGPTVTVTATAVPDSAAPLDPLGAWTVCYGFLTRYADRQGDGFVIPQLRSYDPQWVTPSAGGFQVQISPDGTGWGCQVSGTAGTPVIESWTSVP